jgi:transcriptional regulator GlxA family with amidase domain
VLGTDVDELGERLSACQGLDAKKRFMVEFFRKAGLASVMPDQSYCRATELVRASGGRIRVEELAKTLTITTRTLERMFREHAGISPKKFIRLVRFQNILSQLRSGADSMNLAAFACEWGYADQSHFIRDFKSLMHAPPGAI